MLTAESVLDLTVFICITCGVLRKRSFHGELRFLTQARQIYGKSITILFSYMINHTEKDTTDGPYSYRYNFKWPTPLFSWDRQRLQYKWLWSFYT